MNSTKAALQVAGATGVVAMAVADDHILDLRRIQSELLQPADDRVFHRVVEDRVENDDALGSSNRPCGILDLAYVKEIVEDLDRLGVP